MMKQTQLNKQTVLSENKVLRKEQGELKIRIEELERELSHFGGFPKDMSTERQKNLIIVGLKGDQNCKVDIKKSFDALNIDVCQVAVLPSKKREACAIYIYIYIYIYINFKCEWCKEESILVRKNEGDPVIKITLTQVASLKTDQ